MEPARLTLSLGGSAVRLKWMNGNPAAMVRGLSELPGKVNYLLGNDPARWHLNVPTYGRIGLGEIFPGIDLALYGNQRRLEYDFIVAPGADPRAIQFSVEGARGMHLDRSGDLVLRLESGEIRQHRPVVYQLLNGTRRNIEGRYVIRKDRVAFDIAGYDKTKPLVIDPVLSYSTYLGGSGGDIGFSVAVDSSGSAYVAGSTSSANFPATPGALQSSYGGTGFAGRGDGFVAKLNPAGTALVYSTYLGGSGDDEIRGIAVDSAGNAYLTGETNSSNFPVVNAFQPSFASGTGNAFVSKLNATGSALLYSTYLGGNASVFIGDQATSIAVDSAGNAYAAGNAFSSNFPTRNALQTAFGGGLADCFVAKFDPAGTLLFSTYLGGNAVDTCNGMALDSGSNIWLTGGTESSNFPVTAGALQPANSGGRDVHVTEISSSGSAILYATYLGGTGSDEGLGIAVDSLGNRYVAGYTESSNFPTLNPTQAVYGGAGDGFVAKLNAAGSALLYSTYLGGSGFDEAAGITVDSIGGAYIVGETSSTNFPTANALQAANGGAQDAFVSKLNAAGSALDFSTYVGGSANDYAVHIALDPLGGIYVMGGTLSGDFPVTSGAVQTTFGGTGSGFGDAVAFKLALPSRLLVLDHASASIYQYDSNGAFVSTFIPVGAGGLAIPAALVYGPDGNVYVSSIASNGLSTSILRYNGQTGAFLGTFVPAGSGGAISLGDIAFGPDGNLYAADYSGGNIKVFNGTTGAFLKVFATPAVPSTTWPQNGQVTASLPSGLNFGPDGSLYLAEESDVEEFAGGTGAFIRAFPNGSNLADIEPVAVAFGPDGNLYVATAGPCCPETAGEILKYSPTTGALLGVFVPQGSGGLQSVGHIVFRPDGYLYVSSTNTAGVSSTRTILKYNSGSGAFVGTFIAPGGGPLLGVDYFTFGPPGATPPPVDSTPPVITPTITGTPGANNWYTSAVSVTWSVSDPESSIASSTGCGTTNLTSNTAGTTVTCSATNGAGLSNSVSVTIQIDMTPPVIMPTVMGTLGPNNWYVSPVSVSWSVGDPESGIASSNGCTTVNLSSNTTGTMLTCSATNGAGLSNSVSVTIKINLNPPAVQIQNWTQLAPSGAPPRGGYTPAAVLDSLTNQLLVFGGEDRLGSNFNQVWALSLGASPQWALVNPSGAAPAPRNSMTTVYDQTNSRMIMFGGGLGFTSPCANDVWVLSNANGVNGTPAWNQLSPAGPAPSPRNAHSAVYDPASNRMIVFGGDNCFSTYNNEVWVLSNANGLGGTPAWTQLAPAGTPPDPSQAQNATYDPVSNRMTLFAVAVAGAHSNQVWVLTNANGLGGTPTWIQLNPSGTLIPPRNGAAAGYNPATNQLTVFGGGDTSQLNDTWVLTHANGLGGTPAWTQLSLPGPLPAPRSAAAAYDPDLDRLVIFGGYSDTIPAPNVLSDAWVLDTTFVDGFESPALSPWWTVSGPAITSLTTATAHSGSQSLEEQLVSTFPWNSVVTHDLGSARTGSVAVFAKSALGTPAQSGIQIDDANNNWLAVIEYSTYTNNFAARVNHGSSETDVNFNGDPSVWHLFEISVTSTGVTLKFDGSVVLTDPSVTSFRYVDLTTWSGPSGTAYYDDFTAIIGPTVAPPPDTTPPVITPTITGTLGTNNWYTSAVSVTWGVADPESGIASSTGCGTTNLTSNTTGTTLTCSATNGAGLSNSVSVTIKIDQSAPITTPTITGTLGTNNWYTSAVSVTWSVTDPESGIASFTGCGTTNLTSNTTGTTLTCSATNGAGLSNSASGTIHIDTTPPVVTVTGVANGAVYILSAVPAAGCSTTDSVSGVAVNASVTITGGLPSGLGTFTATCSGGKDNAGNTAAAVAATYTVQAPPPAQKAHLYVVSNAVPSTISVLNINSSTGVITPIAGSPFSAGASPSQTDVSFAAIHPSGQYLYVALFGGSTTNNVAAFAINSATGGITPIPGSPFSAGIDTDGLTVDPTGRFVFFTDLNSSKVAAMAVNQATGALSPVTGSPFDGGVTGFSSVAVEPTGHFAYFTSNGSPSGPTYGQGPIAAFAIDQTTGALTPVPGSPFAAGVSTGSAVVDPTGQFLYAMDSGNGGAGQVLGFSIQPGSGSLVPIPGSPWSTPAPGGAIALAPSGRFAYAVESYGGMHLNAYSLDSTTGALTPLSGSPFSLSITATQVIVDPSGKFLYASSAPNNAVMAFSLDATTGVPTAITGSPFTSNDPLGLAVTSPVTLNPTVRAFGNQGLSSATAPKAVTINNHQSVPLTLGGSTITGANPGDFVQSTTSCGTTLPAQSSCTISIQFVPAALGLRTATLTITDSADNSPQTVTLTGTGVQPITVTPATLGFGTQGLGSPTAAKKATVINNTSSALSISSIAIGGANASDFAQVATTCGAILGAQANCSISIQFTPGATGSRTATLTVTDAASNSPQTATLTGTGVQPITVSPGTLGFGSQGLNSPTTAKTVTVSSNVNSTTTFSSISIAGANPGDFIQSGTTCGATLAPQASCAITVQFIPTATGARTAILTISDDAGNSPQTVTLTGTGVQPVTATPGTVGFGSQGLNNPSNVKIVTVDSNINSTVTFTSIAITGANPGDFIQSGTTCGVTLAPQASCTISIQFSPMATGARSATLTISDDAGNSPQTATLTGTGVQPVTATPASLGFGSQAVGGATAAKTVIVSSNINSPVTFAGISITGANPGDFIQSGTTCGTTLAPQANCTISIQFSPTATGARSATLTITDNAGNSPQTVNLTGTGR